LRSLTGRYISHKYSDKWTRIGVDIEIYVWAIIKVIFNYTGSPGEKILQKVLERATFLTHAVH